MKHCFVSRLSALALVLFIASTLPASAIIFVSTTGNDGNTGVDWANAKRTIQAGVTTAAGEADKTVWVAQNMVPVPQYVENVTVPAGVLVYGSFVGNEDPLTFDINTRNFAANPSIVDPAVAATSIFTLNDGCRLDGFVVENGAAALGAGVLTVANSNCTIANCTIRNNSSATSGAGLQATAAVAGVIVNVTACTFSGNTSDLGGGVFADGVNLTVNGGSTFTGNTARYGGAIYAVNRYLSATGVTFAGNVARDTVIALNSAGGAIFAKSETVYLTACTFTDNTAQVTFTPNGVAQGGGVYAATSGLLNVNRCRFNNCVATGATVATHYGYGGGIYSDGINATLTNNFFYNCSAQGAGDPRPAFGGAIYFHNQGVPNIRNNTFYGNEVTPQAGSVSDPDRSYGLGSCIYLAGSGPAYVINNILTHSLGTAIVNEGALPLSPGMTVTLNYNLFWHNAGGDLFGLTFPATNDHNLMLDPQLRNVATGDLHILFGSPAKNAGQNSGSPGTDIDGEARPWPALGVVDIGADEFVDTDNDGGADNDPAETTPNAIVGPAEVDPDGDGVYTPYDNCPAVANPTQVDSNGDKIGDACTPLAGGGTTRVYFVDGSVASSGDGLSWATAFKTIQEGIDAADSHNQAGWTQNYEVWVRGNQTYTENVMIWHGVVVYGAWAGTELPTDVPDPRPNRNLNTQTTIIDGNSVNSAVIMSHLPQDRYLTLGAKTIYDGLVTVLDGFEPQNGRAEIGGGVSVYKDLVNITATRVQNSTAALGGGVYMYRTNGILGDGLTPPPATLLNADSWVHYNTATGPASYAGYGGGIYIERGAPTVFADSIEGNTAFFGGGIAIRMSAPTLLQCLVGCAFHAGLPDSCNNTAVGDGTGNGKGGGLYIDNGSNPTIDELTIVDNQATGATGQGGGIWLGDNSNMSMDNTIVAFNTASHVTPALRGGAIFATGTAPVITDPWCWIRYSDFWSNSVTQFTGIPDPTSPPVGSACMLTNYAVDPLFVDRTNCNYSLAAESPLRGVGDPAEGSPNVGAFQDEDPLVGIADAKNLANGTIVEIRNVIVTAVFADGFYIEELDRSAGIKVRWGSAPVTVGQLVSLTGVMTSNGIEREVMNPELTLLFTEKAKAAHVGPLALTNAALGGGPNGLQSGVSDWIMVMGPDRKTKKVAVDAKGLNNVGLLVKTWGRVVSVNSGSSPSFVISDGYKTSVTVLAPADVSLPSVGEMVIVRGISTISAGADGSRNRAVRLRDCSDITRP